MKIVSVLMMSLVGWGGGIALAEGVCPDLSGFFYCETHDVRTIDGKEVDYGPMNMRIEQAVDNDGITHYQYDYLHIWPDTLGADSTLHFTASAKGELTPYGVGVCRDQAFYLAKDPNDLTQHTSRNSIRASDGAYQNEFPGTTNPPFVCSRVQIK